jgi:hypothetical protein
MYPFFVSMSCLAGNFTWPEWLFYPSLGEALLKTQGKGAVAALVPTGQTTTEGQHILNTALFDAIFTRDIRRLGPAIAQAKQTLLANGDAYYGQVGRTFVLLGDPAMALKIPLPRKPRRLKAKRLKRAIILAWQLAHGRNGRPVAGYNLYRSPNPQGGFVRVNGDLITATEYVDAVTLPVNSKLNSSAEFADGAALQLFSTYYYALKAVDTDGTESVRSEVVAAALSETATGTDGATGAGCFISAAARSEPQRTPGILALLAAAVVLGLMIRVMKPPGSSAT